MTGLHTQFGEDPKKDNFKLKGGCLKSVHTVIDNMEARHGFLLNPIFLFAKYPVYK